MTKKKGGKRQPFYEHNERILGYDKYLPVDINKTKKAGTAE